MLPTNTHCPRCSKPVAPEPSVSRYHEGTYVCGRCARHEQVASGDLIPFSIKIGTSQATELVAAIANRDNPRPVTGIARGDRINYRGRVWDVDSQTRDPEDEVVTLHLSQTGVSRDKVTVPYHEARYVRLEQQ